MAQSFTGKKRIRKSFGKIAEAVTMPNLIEVQKSSYDQFLQKDVPLGERRDHGIEAVFKSVFSNMSRLNLRNPSLTLKNASSAT
jgi:DNA-directed RNA polymerase subunit beta